MVAQRKLPPTTPYISATKVNIWDFFIDFLQISTKNTRISADISS
jgi:hypothetical protein